MFKAKVALEAIRGEATVAQPTVKHGVHQTMIDAWKKQAAEGMAEILPGKSDALEAARDGEVEKLYAMIGQLAVELDLLRRASGRVTRDASAGGAR